MSPSNINHVYPVRDVREHITDGASVGVSCWCGPLVWQLCPECEGRPYRLDGCWRCKGEGWLDAWTDDPGYPTVIVHRRKEEVDRYAAMELLAVLREPLGGP